MAKQPEHMRQPVEKRCEAEWLTATYDQYYLPIYRYIYQRIGDVETARELTADVFQRLIQVVCRGNTFPENERAWLYQSAHNLVIDEYRRREHRQHLPLQESMASNEDDPLETAHQHLAGERIRALLKLLTPDQQQVLTLKFLQGFSNQEIAEITGKPVTAIKSLQHRGLAALHQMLLPVTQGNSQTAIDELLTPCIYVESL